MKKILFILLIFLSSNILFSLDNNYFKTNIKIDHLFVNSLDGLRIRDEPSLSGNRIGVLYDRMSIKVVSIGNETEIDGIKSNWIKILLPLETIKNQTNIYGWVFGGYLTNELKSFSTIGWSDSDLQRYLCRFSWVNGQRTYRRFDLAGTYSMGLLESGFGGDGKYSLSMKENTITVEASYGDEESESEIKTDVYYIKNIEEDRIILNVNNEDIELKPSLTNSYFWGNLSNENIRIGTLEETSYNALLFSFATNMIKNIGSINLLKEVTNNLVKMGILIEDDEYKEEYNSYWNLQ